MLYKYLAWTSGLLTLLKGVMTGKRTSSKSTPLPALPAPRSSPNTGMHSYTPPCKESKQVQEYTFRVFFVLNGGNTQVITYHAPTVSQLLRTLDRAEGVNTDTVRELCVHWVKDD